MTLLMLLEKLDTRDYRGNEEVFFDRETRSLTFHRFQESDGRENKYVGTVLELREARCAQRCPCPDATPNGLEVACVTLLKNNITQE